MAKWVGVLGLCRKSEKAQSGKENMFRKETTAIIPDGFLIIIYLEDVPTKKNNYLVAAR